MYLNDTLMKSVDSLCLYLHTQTPDQLLMIIIYHALTKQRTMIVYLSGMISSYN
jgi:hypothetical protein